MKTLILVRHGNAVGRRKNFTDIDRSLTPGGQRKAKRNSAALKVRGISPSLMISSTAFRAVETAHIAADVFEYPPERILLRPMVYEPRDTDALFTTIRDLGDNNETVMLVGHNPSLEDFAGELVKGSERSIPKAGVMVIGIDRESWSELLPGDGRDLTVVKAAKSGKTAVDRAVVKQLRKEARVKMEAALVTIAEEIQAGSAKKMKREIARAAGVVVKRLTKLAFKQAIVGADFA